MPDQFLYPSKAEHRIGELTSSYLSNETKANVARWYAEMMIKEFLSSNFQDPTYKKESLGYLIENLKGKVSTDIINSILLIKDFGDKASHYNPELKISNKQSEKAVEESKKLYELIILDILRKKSLFSHPDRATLISVLLPKTRVSIYSSLINFDSSFINQELLKKWCIACVKNNQANKAKHRLNQLLKKGTITKTDYSHRVNDMKTIETQKNNDQLPIPKNRADFARNLNDLLNNHISEQSKLDNNDLVKVLLSMAENITPSEMGSYKGMQVFQNDI